MDRGAYALKLYIEEDKGTHRELRSVEWSEVQADFKAQLIELLQNDTDVRQHVRDVPAVAP